MGIYSEGSLKISSTNNFLLVLSPEPTRRAPKGIFSYFLSDSDKHLIAWTDLALPCRLFHNITFWLHLLAGCYLGRNADERELFLAVLPRRSSEAVPASVSLSSAILMLHVPSVFFMSYQVSSLF